ncbi:MAG: hypothetical protein KF802_01040 [Bdellovibrionaceae bacterium]|nr:hypothetical protein [Pseudobdellovibrionaceae bacterium]MBX3034305.1 hypothetical protein [Pseudobdellovibrionaceae bacterium]
MGKNFIFGLLILAGGALAHAQESANTSTLKASDVKPVEKTQEQIDKEITNARLRASLGSKSKWSVKTSLGFDGSTIERPLDPVRPDIGRGTSPNLLSSLYGSLGVKRSLSERDSLTLGSRFAILSPFSGDLSRSEFADPRKKNATMERYKASSPYLSYDRGDKIAAFQMSTNVTYTHATDNLFVNEMKQAGILSFSQSMLTDFDGSNWTAGAALSLALPIYSGQMSDYAATAGYTQTDYAFGLYPFAEYSFNDRYSLRTVFGYFGSEKTRGAKGDPGAVIADVPYQSVGIGMSITRDIYVYPNVQFAPFDIRPARTNVAMSAFVNMF